MKKCPFCAEEIQEEAIVCKHCGRDLTPSASKDLSTVKTGLENAIREYISFGYEIVSRLETAAVLERRAPVNVPTLIALFLMFWPAALVYIIPGVRKSYRVQLAVSAGGQLDESGGTLDKYEHDTQRAKMIGWILLGILALLVFAAMASSMSRY